MSVLGPSAPRVGQGPRRGHGRGWLLRPRGHRMGHRRRRGLHCPRSRGDRRPRRRVLPPGRGGGLHSRDRRGVPSWRYWGERLGRRRRRRRRGCGRSRSRLARRYAVSPPLSVLSHRSRGGRLWLGVGDRRRVGPRAAPRSEQHEKRDAEQNADSGRGQDDSAPARAGPTWCCTRRWIGLRRRQKRRVDQDAPLRARPSTDVSPVARGTVQTLVDVRFNAARSHSPAKGSRGRLVLCRRARAGGAAGA